MFLKMIYRKVRIGLSYCKYRNCIIIDYNDLGYYENYDISFQRIIDIIVVKYSMLFGAKTTTLRTCQQLIK